MRNTPSGISAEIAKGVFRPHTALTNMALSYYQNAANYFARAIFSICPVGLSSDNYYIFDKEDLLRDNWQRKPAYGKVAPAVVSEHTDTYNCQVDQMIMGIDQIRQTDLQRRMGPAIRDPKQQRTKTIAEQANIHQDMDCRMAVHLLCPDKAMNLKMLAAVMQKISVDEKIILLDNSPMNISEVQIDKQADYLKQGQLYVTGRFGVLKYKEKPHAIESIITM